MSLKTVAAFVVVIVLLVAGIWIGKALAVPGSLSQYSAVYLATGDMYFGKFSRWPTPHISGAWHLDRGPNGEVGLSPLRAAVWGPASTIYFNDDQVIFWARLRSDSPIAQAFDGKGVIQLPPQQATPTSTSEEQPAP